MRDLLQLNLKYGLGVDKTPRLDDPDFVSTLVFDPSRGATTPKARFAYLFPSSSSAMIQVRLKPGLDDAERERATALVRDAVRMPAFALHNADGYTVTGVPVLAQDVTEALAGSLVRLLLVALLVMAARAGARVPAPAAARAAGRSRSAAVALTFGLMALVGAPLTMASIAVLPVLLGLAVDYAIQYQARIPDPPSAASAARAARRAVPVIATAALATAAGFLVLLLSPVPMVRGFGVLLVVGVGGRVRVRAHRRDGGAAWARRPSPGPLAALGRRSGRAARRRGAAAARAGGGRRAARRRHAPRRAGASRARARGRPRAGRARLGRGHADRGALGPPAARPAGPAGGARPRHAPADDRRRRRGRRPDRGARPGSNTYSGAPVPYCLALNTALDTRFSGGSVTWQNPASGSRGSITPLRTFRTANGRWCREYRQELNSAAQSEQQIGMACREADGWQLKLERPWAA